MDVTRHAIQHPLRQLVWVKINLRYRKLGCSTKIANSETFFLFDFEKQQHVKVPSVTDFFFLVSYFILCFFCSHSSSLSNVGISPILHFNEFRVRVMSLGWHYPRRSKEF